METIIDTGIYTAWGLALDHAGGNIFWSVSGTGAISVAKKDGSSARTLLTSPDIIDTGDVVLDPRNELVYWVDSSKGKIDRAAMDGSGQTTIITGLRNPGFITIDFKEDRLYYRNHSYGVYSSDLLGKDIRQVLYEDGKWVFGIAVDEDVVYWSSVWQDSSSSWQAKIGKLSKSDLTKTVLVDGLVYPNGIYLSTAAPPGVTNVRP
ncbi:low-density lipoprotein receptor 2-like [Branchiostoma floridae]|uniref:Low-density lipoprotein receptor 2-like n=1 Tax=Branchiostoma floridae TaxID=7739 RepID=A0A9J7LXH8_BRAFL|nr:low-density lipoprotein receptor 2-like [Branchiostoma floridae]